MTRIGRSFNIGGLAEAANIAIVWSICSILERIRPIGQKHESLIKFVADRLDHDFHFAIDTSHIARELGWHPAVALEEALEATVRWYLANPDWIAAASQKADALTRKGVAA